MNENLNLNIKIEKAQPLDIVKLSQAFISLNDLVKEYVKQDIGADDTIIRLENVKEGSDIFELVVIGASLFPVADYINSINAFFDFFKNLKSINAKSVDEIKSNEFLSKANTKRIKDVLNIAQKDTNTSFSISFNNCSFSITADNVGSYTDGVKTIEKIKDFDNDVKSFYENVLIRMQMVKDSPKVVKDKAYCDEILKGYAVSCEVTDPEAKKEILNDPFNNYFLVDLHTHTIDGKIRLYRVIKLHSIIPKDKDE